MYFLDPSHMLQLYGLLNLLLAFISMRKFHLLQDDSMRRRLFSDITRVFPRSICSKLQFSGLNFHSLFLYLSARIVIQGIYIYMEQSSPVKKRYWLKTSGTGDTCNCQIVWIFVILNQLWMILISFYLAQLFNIFAINLFGQMNFHTCSLIRIWFRI